MSLEIRPFGRQKIRYNSANDDIAITYQLIVDGAKVTPTSATIAITRASTEVLAATAMTLTGSLLTYAVDTTTVADFPAGGSYRADIVVTYNSITYDRHLIFDVVNYPFQLTIGADQLIMIDGTVRGMATDGDETLAPLIAAASDAISIDLEHMVIEADPLRTFMVLDNSKLNIAAAYWILYQLFFSTAPEDSQIKWEEYKSRYGASLRAAVSSMEYDKSGDGQEDGNRPGIQAIRLLP